MEKFAKSHEFTIGDRVATVALARRRTLD